MDDSILRGEKEAGYCSDSDNEDDEKGFQPATEDNINDGLPMMPNTGPKGVLNDYKLYQQLKKLEKIDDDRKAIEMHKKTAFSADPNKHEEEEEKEDDEFDDDDEFLRKYHEQRLAQMKEEMETRLNKRFDKLFEFNGIGLLEAIEEQDKSNYLMVVHIYDSITACIQMNKCLEELVRQYPLVKFCKVLAADAGLSLEFKMNALPTLQVYQYSKLIGNFLRVQDKLDREFYPGDVENFLIESGMFVSSKGVVAAS